MNTSLTSFVADANAGVSTEFNVTDWSAFHSNAKSVPFVATGSSFDCRRRRPGGGLALHCWSYLR